MCLQHWECSLVAEVLPGVGKALSPQNDEEEKEEDDDGGDDDVVYTALHGFCVCLVLCVYVGVNMCMPVCKV